ncbi:MAG: metallophosphoesterase [Janthinobacterium lividum]
MLCIPENLTEFLYWFKEQTEEFWRQNPRTETYYDTHEEWPAGIRWTGLSEAEIDRVEVTYGIRFTPDHREFLRILHTLDQPYTYVEEATAEQAEERRQGNICYNWLTDEADIRWRLAQPYQDLHRDWLPVWGPEPATEAERAAGFARQFGKAPLLLPLRSHRYLVSEPQQPGNPVLSMHGFDIIIYGWNLRSYLLSEFAEYLLVQLTEPVLENGEVVDWNYKPEVAAIFQADYAASLSRRIPFYEDYIQTHNGWPLRAGDYGPILMPHFDLIGDIHGHADELRALLHHLGYRSDATGTFRHPENRQVIFLGDYIDRGPKIRETLQLVRGMVAGGAALAIMGNHEYNALAYAAPDGKDGFLRSHNKVHTEQHQATLAAFTAPELQAEWQDCLDWFYTLPLALELPGLRAVHACWDPRHLDYLRQQLPDLRLTPDFLRRASYAGREADAVEITLKGREVTLPQGLDFEDKGGHSRTKMRVRWWTDPATATYDTYYLEDLAQLRGQPVDLAGVDLNYYQDETPVFFGHYWLKGEPQLLQPHAVCLDYSVAKGGKLVGYRWDGEQVLSADKLVWVK